MTELIFTRQPIVEIASNRFIDVPVILRYEDVNLIEIVKDFNTGYSTKIPIYHPDGTLLATAINSRIYPTKDGENSGITIDKYPGLWVCKMNKQEIFEIRQKSPETFKTTAELYANDGYFIKCTGDANFSIKTNNGELIISNLTMIGCEIRNCAVGIKISKDGSTGIGCSF